MKDPRLSRDARVASRVTLGCQIVAWMLVSSARSDTLVVTSADDSGAGTLRQAILDANATPEADWIHFRIAPPGPQTITLSSALPEITTPVEIDGTTQGQQGPIPRIEISGGGRDIPVLLKISAGGTVLRGLTFGNVGRNTPGDCLVVTGPGAVTVAGCWFGVDLTGAVRRRIRGDAIRIENSPNNLIGGVGVAARNVIAGSDRGVAIVGPKATRNRVLGNFIGLSAPGLAAVANTTGIQVQDAPGNQLGGAGPGEGNVIAGNTSQQILVTGPEARGNRVLGNWVGLRPDGTGLAATPALGHGIRIQNAPANDVGGSEPGERNVVANNQIGILVDGTNAFGNIVCGNFVGTSPDGLHAVPNHQGIFLGGRSSGTRVGDTNLGAGNVVSGNRTHGIAIQDSSANVIVGNFVGTDATGLKALGNTTPGSEGSGIFLASLAYAASGNWIGGPEPGAGNVVSGNNDAGITFYGGFSTNNIVAGNLVGVGADGETDLGNEGPGILLLGASTNMIGGETSDYGNHVAHNGGAGVEIAGTFGAGGLLGTNNLVRFNFIEDNEKGGIVFYGRNVVLGNDLVGNQGLPIDVFGDGPTTNSPTADFNFPELTKALFDTNAVPTLAVSGTLQGRPSCDYLIQIFRDGEYVADIVQETGPDGRAVFAEVVVPDPGIHEAALITATATKVCEDPEDPLPPKTSEFSPPLTSTRMEARTGFAFDGTIYTGLENDARSPRRRRANGP